MIISRTPFRVGFVGGATDIPFYYEEHGGMVVSATVDKYVYVMVKEGWGGQLRVSYSQPELAGRFEEIKNTRVRAVLQLLHCAPDLEIVTWSDIPARMGMGGSSSFTVGLINSLVAFSGLSATRGTLAEMACQVELGVLQEPIGKQDQYAAAYGGVNLITFGRKNAVWVIPDVFTEGETGALFERLMFFSTETEHDASQILRDVKERAEIEYLHEIKAGVGPFIDAVKGQQWAVVGTALHENWMTKTKLSPHVVSYGMNEIYERARAAGALGGKLLGAGGGGIVMLLVLPEDRAAVNEAVGLTEICLKPTRRGSEIIYEG